MGLLNLLVPLIKLLGVFNTPAMGAAPALQAVTALVEPGGYYGPTQSGGKKGPSGRSSRSPKATDASSARKLWEVSVSMTGIDPGLSPAA